MTIVAEPLTGAQADRSRWIFAVSLAVTALLYVIPFGRTLAWPLVLVSTLAHELAHGFAAVVLGGQFASLRLNADASGVASWSGGFGRLATATVAGAGLIGPAVAAFVLLVLGRRERTARIVLAVLAAALCVIAVGLVRGAFGIVFTLLLVAHSRIQPSDFRARHSRSSCCWPSSSRCRCSHAATISSHRSPRRPPVPCRRTSP